MSNRAYWQGRFVQLEAASHKSAEETMQTVDAAYRQASRELEGQLSAWYQRFANNNGIVDLADARRLLNAGELKEFKWTVQDYIRAGRENGISADWAKQLENASARFHITRLDALKVQLQNTVEVLYGNQLDALDALAKQTTLDTYLHTVFEIQHQTGVAWDIAGISQRSLQAIISTPWTTDGKNFSERIWGSKTQLFNEFSKLMTQNLMTGGDLGKVVNALSERLNVSKTQAARLVYTENAYFQSLAQEQGYKDLLVKRYVIIATLDERTSDTCRSLDGSVYEMKDFQPGVTAPPFHPWCRSATAPYYDDLAGIGERAARDPETGTTYYVPRSMKYEDWKATFAEGGSKADLTPTGTGAILVGLDACKTVADVEQLMREQNWFYSKESGGKTYDTNQTLSLAGCDLETAKEVYRSCEHIYDVYPQLVGKLNSISTAPLNGSTYAQCSVGIGHGGVTLNNIWFRNLEKLEKSYQHDLLAGFHPKNTTARSIVTHEMGHALDDYLTNTLMLAGVNGWRPKYVSAAMRPKVMKACGLKVADTRTEVSGYATKDHFEWFAECFAESLDSTEPRQVAVEFGKQLDEYLKKVK